MRNRRREGNKKNGHIKLPLYQEGLEMFNSKHASLPHRKIDSLGGSLSYFSTAEQKLGYYKACRIALGVKASRYHEEVFSGSCCVPSPQSNTQQTVGVQLTRVE